MFIELVLFTFMYMYIAASPVSSKHEELESLYASVNHVITEGLSNFEKATALNLPQLQCTLLILKAACNNDPTYIDRLVLSLSHSLLSLSLSLSLSPSLSLSLFPSHSTSVCLFP